MLAEKLAAVSGVRAVGPVGPGRFRLLAEGDVRPQAAAAVVNAAVLFKAFRSSSRASAKSTATISRTRGPIKQRHMLREDSPPEGLNEDKVPLQA